MHHDGYAPDQRLKRQNTSSLYLNYFEQINLFAKINFGSWHNTLHNFDANFGWVKWGLKALCIK